MASLWTRNIPENAMERFRADLRASKRKATGDKRIDLQNQSRKREHGDITKNI
jgi:hypothetical protein